jgi:uncharacterized alkaline shock family protein YloU
MIISDFVEMELTNRTFKKLVKKYKLSPDLKEGDFAKISIKDLSKSSHYEIDITCDYCGKELRVSFKRYNLSTKLVNKYACSSIECSNQKIKDICQAKWGVDNPFQSGEVKDKIKETLVKKYGVEHPMYMEQTKDKIKKTCLERYGETNYTKTEDYKIKTIDTNLKKWGVEWTLQSEEIREKGKKSNLERWGVEYSQQSELVRSKTIKTNLEKWGVECNLQSEETKEKIKLTLIKNYGVDNPLKSEEIKEKIKLTLIKKYGVDSPLKNEEIQKKVKLTNLNKWGSESITSSDLFRNDNYLMCKDDSYLKYLGNNISLFNCDKGHQFEINTSQYYNRIRNNSKICTICYPIGDSKSIKEKELFLFIKSIYKDGVIKSYRDGLEIDIYLPNLKIGFEFNGLYWHSEKYKEKDYHIKKTKYFEEKGIRIIHIWEDDWDFKRKILESQIKNWIGLIDNKIFARKCEVIEINNSKISSEFLEINHIQGKVNSSLKLGLYYNGDLISLMTFDHFEGRNKISNDEWNINRFCNKLGFTVIGGASKLLKHFIVNYNPKRIISYADRDWSKGELYEKLGFQKISQGKPDYKYIIGNKRKNKSKFRKSNLPTELSEANYMKKSHIDKIWDCGKIKFEMSIN